MLAESVSIDGGLLLVFLIIALVALVAFVAVAVGGCVLAYKAGSGSSGALGGWIAVVAVETTALFLSTASLLAERRRLNPFLPITAFVLMVQVGFFLLARAGRR
ncbi:MAG: hypothetical protein M3Z84_06230 [Actinomycetota bacterium]|nr:hypothetical protein [Actinomycetota bacterium]